MDPTGPDLKTIFIEALELPPGPDRAAFLDRACVGNASLQLEVESLLKAHDQAGDFLADAGITVRRDRPAILEGPGTTIGPYKLLQQIGEGGMGVVFMAEQEKPVRRKVALKVIKPGMDTRQVIARFEAERQALAMMDHPNIARVLDVGATDTGRPFFVMELVKGVPITDYCDRNHLSPKERLELFIPACQAIQSAHQKGIIHRDIKPSNVLVTLHDGKPVPKVIDFGVAKAIDQRLTEKTMFTEFGAVIGTLEYMSPEQAEMGALDVDTRSDIYSLGVLLYELLTGSTPLEHAKLRKAAYSEVLRRIREEEPTKPSTRLSESKNALPSISAQRKMEPARLMKLVKGDLDWIVMKSLEKDRTRRYETATGFARDIQRYLDGDPVEACPPSAPYKLRKFARKHRAALATAGAFAFLLVAATAVSLGLAYWANRERDRAVAAENSAKEQKGRAQDREQMAIDAMNRFADVIRETPELKNNPALAPLRAKLLKEPQEFFKKLTDRLQADKETTPESLARLATASFRLGNLTSEIGNKEKALDAHGESLAIRERLVLENPSAAGYQSALASTHNNIGILLRETGRADETLAHHERARDIRERLAREHPSVAEYQNDLATSHNNIGILLKNKARPAEALASYELARSIRERLARDNPSVTEYENNLAASHNNIGNLRSETGHPAEALASHTQSRAICERLAREHPSVAEYQNDLATSHNNIGVLLKDTGRPAEALASYELARSIRERLARDNPSVAEYQNDLAASHNNIGVLLKDTGRTIEALASYERARDIWERLAREHPSVAEYQNDLAASHSNIGNLVCDAGRPADALAPYELARSIRERLARDNPSIIEYQNDLAASYFNIGNSEYETGRLVEALASMERARDIRERLAREHPSITEYQDDLAKSHNNIGVLLGDLDRPIEAMRSFEQSLAMHERLAREHPESPDFAYGTGVVFYTMAKLELKQEKFEGASEKLVKALEWGRKATASDPGNSTYRTYLAAQLRNLARAHEALGRTDEADQARRELADFAANDPAKKALDARLADVLRGQPAKDDAERLALANRAYEKSLHASSARLYAEALAKNPKLADDREDEHTYNAACAAALAGCALGKDDPPPDDTAKAKLRGQALDWLKSELAAWTKVIDTDPDGMKAAMAKSLQHWKVDTDLPGIRDEKELAKLPEEERAGFRQLWADVDRLLARASGGK